MFLGIDEVAVPRSELAKARAGDAAAKDLLRSFVKGLDLYMHALSVDADAHEAVTLRELKELGIIDVVHVVGLYADWGGA